MKDNGTLKPGMPTCAMRGQDRLMGNIQFACRFYEGGGRVRLKSKNGADYSIQSEQRHLEEGESLLLGSRGRIET